MDETERLLGRELLLGMTEGVPMHFLHEVVESLRLDLPRKARGNRAKIGMHLQRLFDENMAAFLEGVLRMACRLQEIDAEVLRERLSEEGVRREHILLVSSWLLMREKRLEVFVEAAKGLDLTDFEAQVQEILRRQRAYEEAEARRREEARRAVAAASMDLQHAERQAAAARVEAERQVDRTNRTAKQAGARVAEAEGKRRQLEQDLAAAREENAVLREVLRERDEQFKRLEEDYRARLQGVRTPQLGRVLIVADPNRAAGYKAEAMAMGATEVDFFDGRERPNDRLQGLLAAADIVIVNVAWCKHECSNAVRRSRAQVGYMYVPGLRAFRDALEEVGRAALISL